MFASPSTESLLPSLTQYPVPVKFVSFMLSVLAGQTLAFFEMSRPGGIASICRTIQMILIEKR